MPDPRIGANCSKRRPGSRKYKTRRRTAELKLEAARLNLVRIDDIVFEVERQRNALKRQAAKARRYRRLRGELRRWEKVHFARRYRELAQAIDAARARLAEARIHEQTAATESATGETRYERLRIELAEGESGATAAARGRARSGARHRPPAAAAGLRDAAGRGALVDVRRSRD